jgi:hypothetical protein
MTNAGSQRRLSTNLCIQDARNYFEDAVHCTISDLLTASFGAPLECLLVILANNCNSPYPLAKACIFNKNSRTIIHVFIQKTKFNIRLAVTLRQEKLYFMLSV